MPDLDALRLTVAADISQLKAGMAAAATEVSSSAAQMQAAVIPIGEGFDTIGNKAEVALDSMEVNFVEARHAAMLLGEETGVHLPRALAAVAARSSILGPILENAFPIVAGAAFVAVIGAAVDKIEQVTAAMAGYTAEVQRAEQANVELSTKAISSAADLEEAQSKLQSVLSESGKLASEGFGQKFSASLEKAYGTSSLLGASLKDPIAGFVALSRAESDWANETVRASEANDKLVEVMPKLAAEQAREAEKLIDLQAASAKADPGLTHSKQIEVEINALKQKQSLEEEIARAESAAKGGDAAAQARAVAAVQEESYEKIQALTKELKTAQLQEYDEIRKKGEEIFDHIRDHALATLNLEIAATQERQHAEAEFSTAVLAAQDKETKAAAELANQQIEARQRYAEASVKIDEESAARSIEAQSQQVALKLKLQEMTIESSPASGATKAKAMAAAQVAELEQLRAFEEQKLQIELDAREKEMTLLKGGKSDVEFTTTASPEQLAQYQQLQAQIEAAKQQAAAKIQQINGQIVVTEQQATITIQKYWESAFSMIDRPFETAIDGILRGTETASLAFRRMGSEILMSVINTTTEAGLKWTEHFLLTELLEKSASANRLATVASGEAVKRAMLTTSNTLEITGDAAKGGAATFASVLEALPFPYNVETAPGVAATQVGAIEAFAAGSFEHGGIVPINAHAGEMVLPKDLSEGVQNAIRGGGLKGGTGGGDTHYHNHFHIGSVHGASAGELVKQLKTMVRRGELNFR